jgi:hypothetical protein
VYHKDKTSMMPPVRVQDWLYEVVQRQAQTDGLTVSQIIRQLLGQYVKDTPAIGTSRDPGPLLALLEASVDSGSVNDTALEPYQG